MTSMPSPGLQVVRQLSHPYLSPARLSHVKAAVRASTMTETREEQIRLNSCAWIETIGKDLRFPVRTIGTAMMVYHKFHLTYPMSDYNAQDICTASLFVAAKMEDTLKKANQVIAASLAQRNPQNAEIDLESAVMEEQKRRVIGLERMMLESRTFDFRHRHPQPFLIKFAKALRIERIYAHFAWKMCIDSYRTLLPLQVPPHTIALACLILSCKVQNQTLNAKPGDFEVDQRHLVVALEGLLDLYVHIKGATLSANMQDDTPQLMSLKPLLLAEYGGIGLDEAHRQSPYKPINLSQAGDRGTCRFILEPERAGM